MKRLIYFVAHLGLWSGSLLISPFQKKIRRGVMRRFGLTARLQTLGLHAKPNVLWCHIASSGELEQALPILDRLKASPAAPFILVSFFSPSGEKAIRLETERRESAGRKLSWDAADYSPFDFPWSANAFVKAVHPQKLLLIHRELWPEMVTAALNQGVKIYWVNVLLSQKTPIVVRWLQSAIHRFTYIGTVNESSQRLLQSQLRSAVPMEAVGDSRVDRILGRKHIAPTAHRPLSRKILILASLWPEDWQVISEAVFELLTESPDWAVWIVPHELDEKFAQRIALDFQNHRAPLQRITAANDGERSSGNGYFHLVGKLAELYQLADLVFVGGSFKAKVHNVLEPAAYGKAILTGPYIQNSAEALVFQSEGGLLAVVAKDFRVSLLKLTGAQFALALEGAYLDHTCAEGMHTWIGFFGTPFGMESMVDRADMPTYYYSSFFKNNYVGMGINYDLGVKLALTDIIPGTLEVAVMDGRSYSGTGPNHLSPALALRYSMESKSGDMSFTPVLSAYLGHWAGFAKTLGLSAGVMAKMGALWANAEFLYGSDQTNITGVAGTDGTNNRWSVYVEPGFDLGMANVSLKAEMTNFANNGGGTSGTIASESDYNLGAAISHTYEGDYTVKLACAMTNLNGKDTANGPDHNNDVRLLFSTKW